MRLVWVVFALVFVSIIGLQESFAEQASGKPIWETNSNQVCGDKLCSEIKESFAEESHIYNLSFDYGIITIPYHIENGTINQMLIDDDKDVPSIEIMIESIDEGTFSIDIKKLSRFVDLGFGDVDDIYVLNNGKEIKFEHTYSPETLILTFPFNTHSNMEIIASSMENLMPNSPKSWMDHTLLKFDKIYSPLEQITNGIDFHYVVCREGLELVFKQDKNPICVTHNTAVELSKRSLLSNPPDDVFYSHAPFANFHIEDKLGNYLDTITVGSEVYIGIDHSSMSMFAQPFQLTFEIKNDAGEIVEILTKTDVLSSGMSEVHLSSWIPDESGKYAIQFDVISDLRTMTPIAPSQVITVQVEP